MTRTDLAVLASLATDDTAKARTARAAILAVFQAFAAYAVTASKRGAFRVPGVVAGVVECDAPLPRRTSYRDDETATLARVETTCAAKVRGALGDGARVTRLVWEAFARDCIARHDAGLPWCVPGVLNVAHATGETTDDAREAAFTQAERVASRRK